MNKQPNKGPPKLKCLARTNKGLPKGNKVSTLPPAYLCLGCGHKQQVARNALDHEKRSKQCDECEGVLCRICALCLYTKLSSFNRTKFCCACQHKQFKAGVLVVAEEEEDDGGEA
jgi:hypothetical protein